MSVTEALALIASDQPHDRLRGARHLILLARKSDATTIQKALAKETVPWVKKALERASMVVRQREEGPSLPQQFAESAVDPLTLRDIRLQAGEQVVSILLHEVGPKVGYIRNAALRELKNFDKSDTKRQIEHLEGFLKLLSEFREISHTPNLEEFDLADLVDSVVGEQVTENVQLAGQRPFVVQGEPRRIRLALTNGLRNAVEANTAVGDSKPRLVAINWGMDDQKFWISIVDEGVGIQVGSSGMFDIGSTTKADHFGMGLPLAKQAMNSLGGDVTLLPRDQGGARLEISWNNINLMTQ